MHIINIMFSNNLGGIEQSFLDYCKALSMQNHKVTTIISPKSAIIDQVKKLNVNMIRIKNFGQWDIFAKSYIRKTIEQQKPDAIIVHGNRAICLTKDQAGKTPIIGVTHNYSVKHLIGLDAIFATTEDLKQTVIEKGFSENKIFKIPNMIELPLKLKEPQEKLSNPVIIGTMGRFVKKKGFDIFLHAIAQLKDFNIKAIIGGQGEEEQNLKNLAKELQIEDKVEFTGWIQNKEKFFEKIDIFCLPSLHEPFGIILLEAFANGKPVITSASEGPLEIVKSEHDSIIVPISDSKALANAINNLINSPELVQKITQNAYKTVEKYSLQNVSKLMDNALKEITKPL